MNNIFDEYKSLVNMINESVDFKIDDFIYYLGINIVNNDLSEEEIKRLINICKNVNDDKINSLRLAKNLTAIVYEKEYMTLEQLERVSIETIHYYFIEEKMDELEYYYDSYQETMTPAKQLKEGGSYTVARVMDNGYCAEIHYCSEKGATVEYSTKESHNYWSIEVENIDWFKLSLDDDYILNRLNCLYEDKFSSKTISQEKYDELDLVSHVLLRHKVSDIELHITDEGILVGYDDDNFWSGKELYDFMFNELFVYNRDGKVELIDESDYKKLEEYRKQYSEPTKEIEMEIEYD